MTAAHRTPLSLAATIAADIADAWAVVKTEARTSTRRPDSLLSGKQTPGRVRRDYIKVLAMLGLRTAVAAPEQEHEQTLEEILGE